MKTAKNYLWQTMSSDNSSGAFALPVGEGKEIFIPTLGDKFDEVTILKFNIKE